MSLGVFAAIVFLTLSFRPNETISDQINIPPELRETFTTTQLQVYTLLQEVEGNPESANALLSLGNIFFELGNYPRAAVFYEQYLALQPDNLDATTDLAASYFSSGKTDQAIQTVNGVLAENPEHIKANFNLGIMLWQGKGDLVAAKKQLEKVIELTAGSTDQTVQGIAEMAKNNIAEITKTLNGESQTATGGA